MTPASKSPLEISIIIPCFNCERTLREAVASCYTQGFAVEAFEVVMVDDQSTDGTYVLMAELANEYPNVLISRHEVNKGGGATRNTATELASSNLVFCLDSDDMLSPFMLKKMVAMQHETNADGIGIETSVKFRGTNVDDVAFTNVFGYRNERIPLESLLQRDGVMCPLYSTFLYTKSAFAAIGGYPTDHGFDTQGIAWRFLAHGLTAYTCPDTVYHHRVHFNESYYHREHNAGRTNVNWKKILLENNAVLTDEAFAVVLKFNERNPEIDLITELKKIPNVFSATPKVRTLTAAMLATKSPVPRTSLLGLYYRIAARIKRYLQNA